MAAVFVPDKDHADWDSHRGEGRRVVRCGTADVQDRAAEGAGGGFETRGDVRIDRSDRGACCGWTMEPDPAALLDAGDDASDVFFKVRQDRWVVGAYVQGEMKGARHDRHP